MQLPVSAVRTSDLTEKLMSHTTVVDGVEYISVHPTFLYESFWNLCLFILLMLYFKHRRFDGEVFLLWCRKILDRKPANRPASHPAYQLSGVYGTRRHFGGSISHMDRNCQR